LGGLIIDVLSWHWMFFVNIPVGIVGILMIIRFVPDIKPAGNQKFDFLGAITLFLSLLLLLAALTVGQNLGFTDLRILSLFVIGIGCLALFLFVEKRAQQPMIDLSLFRQSLLSINLVTGFIIFVAISGVMILIPFYLENVLGYSTRQVGLLIAVLPISMGIIAPISGSFSDRFGTRIMAVIGLGVLLFGFALLTTLSIQTSAFNFILLYMPLGVGMGIFQSPNNSAIMGAAPPDKLGVVSGMLALNRTLGQTTGIAIVGAIWAGLTIYYAQPAQIASATDALPTAQVAALQNSFMFITGLILLALGLALWALIKGTRSSSPELEVALTGTDSNYNLQDIEIHR
jgi:EmrB/QacA subfamily drug resistance transporter